MKTCTKCGVDKELSEYYRFKYSKDGVASECKKCGNKRNLKWHKNNKERSKEIKKKWADKNIEKVRQNARNYQERHKEELKIKTDKYYQENKKEIHLRSKIWKRNNREKNNQIKYKWVRKNPLKIKASNARTKAFRKKFRKDTDLTTNYLLKLYKQRDLCPYCGLKAEEWHLEHILPLKRGGTHTKSNVIYCCATCNLRKQKRTLEEFIQYAKEINYPLNVTLQTTSTTENTKIKKYCQPVGS